jgi:hypothetical protein
MGAEGSEYPTVRSWQAGLSRVLGELEARIAQLSGQSALPPLPAWALVVSLGLAAGFLLAFLDLSSVEEMGRLMWPNCF